MIEREANSWNFSVTPFSVLFFPEKGYVFPLLDLFCMHFVKRVTNLRLSYL
jgi:hypothetical protein